MDGMLSDLHQKPMFFRVLMPGFSEKLEIPSAFVKNIIPEKVATIWGPLGKSWSFKIRGSTPNFYFEEGWQQFARAYCLDIGYFLVFCYEGDMDFSVIVLDTSGCRKEYTHLDLEESEACRNIDGLHKVKIEDPDPEGCIGIIKEGRTLEEFPKVSDTTGRQNTPKNNGNNQSSKDTAVKGIKRVSCEHEVRNESLEESICCKKIKMEPRTCEDHFEIGKAKASGTTATKSEKVAKKTSVAKANMKTIKTPKDVACRKEQCISNNEKSSNGTKAGERKRGHKAKKTSSSCKRTDDEEYEGETPYHDNLDGDLCQEKGPTTYKVTLKPRNLEGHYYIYIPVQFKEDIGIADKGEVLLKDPEGELWPVEVIHSTKNRTLLSRGWKEFCVDNKLRAGDECEFEPDPDSEETKKVVQVKIFRPLEEKRLEAFKIIRTCGVNLSEKPSFWGTLSPSGLKNGTIQIPNAFVAATGIREKRKVTVSDETGYSLDVNLVQTTRNRVILSTGWRILCTRNNFKQGDVCEFKYESDSEGDVAFNVRRLDKPPKKAQ